MELILILKNYSVMVCVNFDKQLKLFSRDIKIFLLLTIKLSLISKSDGEKRNTYTII